VSAQSRALNDLADHFEWLRDGDSTLSRAGRNAIPLYNAWQAFDLAHDVIRRTASERTWRARIGRRLGR
jgi:hypothetical protein